MPRKQLRTLTAALTYLVFWTLPLFASANDTASTGLLALKAFTAAYELEWDGPITLSGDTIRQLKKSPNNQWIIESKASSMLASIYEKSNLELVDDQLRPIHYIFKRSVLGKKRNVSIEFDWEANKATNNVADKPWNMSVTPGVQDKLSYQILLQQQVAQGKTEFNFNVADGGSLKEYKFKVDGKTEIEAPIGKYEAIKVKRIRDENSKRQTYIWFAPELDYQIIKLMQIEKENKAYTLLLKKLSP